MEHLSQEQLDALVMGLVSRDDETVRPHLETCAECARRLAREARLESELYEAAVTAPEGLAVVRARRAPGRAWRVALAAAAALAVVAYSTWFLVLRDRPGVALPPARVAGVPPAGTPCVEDPLRLGPAACVLPPQDVCRRVTVERSPSPSF